MSKTNPAVLALADGTIFRGVSIGAQTSASGEVVAAVNFNSPGQVVIAGNSEAVERAMTVAKEAGAKRALPLPVSAPSHCALMKPAAEKLSASLANIAISSPQYPVIHNVTVTQAESPEEISVLLAQQLYSPVRWVETIQSFSNEGIKLVVEAGPGKVLTGLCKRIDKAVNGLAVFDNASLESVLEKFNA